MEGEQPTIAEAEQETPAIAPEATTEETETPVDLQQPDAGQAESEEPEDDGLDDLDFGFQKYRVPRELKKAVEDWRAATTKKEQSVAEQQKALEVQRLKQVEASDAELDAKAELKGIKSQLAQFAKLTPQDWDAHSLHDPIGVQQAQVRWNLLKDRAAELEGIVQKAAKERTEAAQQDLAKRVQETLSEAPKLIPGWKPETANDTIKQLVEFGQSEGIPDQVLQDMWSPQFLKLLHRARIGTLTMQKQATAAPKPTPQPALAPLEKVSGKSPPAASKSLNDIAKSGDMEAYARARQNGRGR